MPVARAAFWLLTLAALSLSVRSALGDPPPLWVAAAAMLVYVVFSTLGVLFPCLQMYGDVTCRMPGEGRGIWLTFDDGPHPRTTPRVLDILDRYEAKATFFVVGRKVQQYPELLKEIVQRGHALGLHGFRHDRLYCFKPPHAVREDIERTQRTIFEAVGQRPTWFRPPIGFVSHRTAAGAKRCQVTLVGYSARGLDGTAGKNADRVLARITRDLRPGAIVLLHDAAERDDFIPTSIEVLPELLRTLHEQRLATRVFPRREPLEAEPASRATGPRNAAAGSAKHRTRPS